MKRIHIYKDIYAEVMTTRGLNTNSVASVFNILKAGDYNILARMQVFSFIELLNSFVSNQLNVDSEYRLSYRVEEWGPGSGYISKIVSKNNQHYLRISIGDDKVYYFEKYECRIISSILRQLMNKCTFIELTDDDKRIRR